LPASGLSTTRSAGISASRAESSASAPRARLGLIAGFVLLLATGFTDAYTFLRHGHVFAEAMTGNLVLVGVGALRPSIVAFWRPLLAYGAFVAGVIALWALARRRGAGDAEDAWAQRATLVVEILVLAVVGALPGSFPQAAITAAISFAAGLQISAFRSVGAASLSTVVMTTNTMQAVNATLTALQTRAPDELARARGLLAALTGFIGGVFLGAATSTWLHDRAAWVGAAAFALAAALQRP